MMTDQKREKEEGADPEIERAVGNVAGHVTANVADVAAVGTENVETKGLRRVENSLQQGRGAKMVNLEKFRLSRSHLWRGIMGDIIRLRKMGTT